MTEDTTLIACEKCSAKFRLKTMMLKIMREVKCPKCGNRVPTAPKPAAPTSDTPAASSTAAAPSPSPAPTAPAVAPAEIQPAATKPAPEPVAAAPATPPAPVDTRELDAARARVSALEEQIQGLQEQVASLTDAKKQIVLLQAELDVARRPSDEVQRLRKESREQAERVTELQQMWIAEQKEARKAHDRADAAEKTSAGMAAQVDQLLREWLATEVLATQDRLRSLQDRVRSLAKPAS